MSNLSAPMNLNKGLQVARMNNKTGRSGDTASDAIGPKILVRRSSEKTYSSLDAVRLSSRLKSRIRFVGSTFRLK